MIYWYRYFCFTRYTDTGINTFDLCTVDGCGLFIAVMVAMAGVVFKLKWLSLLSRPLATLTVSFSPFSLFTTLFIIYMVYRQDIAAAGNTTVHTLILSTSI